MGQRLPMEGRAQQQGLGNWWLLASPPGRQTPLLPGCLVSWCDTYRAGENRGRVGSLRDKGNKKGIGSFIRLIPLRAKDRS